MAKLDEFMALLTGSFNNKEQYSSLQKAERNFPYAEHINTACNEIPEGNNKAGFSYKNMTTADFLCLKLSERFTPALFREKNGVWEGGSISMFTPVMKFQLLERFSKDCLEVSETIEVNGKRTFGYDQPILYKRVPE